MLRKNVRLRYNKPDIFEKIKKHKLYFILILIFISGILLGSLLSAYQVPAQGEITNGLQDNFNSHFYKIISGQNSVSLPEFMLGKSVFFLIVFIFGLCIAGHIIIPFVPFVYGFNIGLIYTYTIYKYTKGFLFTFTVFTPQILIYAAAIVFLSNYAVNFSAKIYTKVFMKNNVLINKSVIKIYLMQSAVLFIIYNLAVIWEYYVTPVIIKTFIK